MFRTLLIFLIVCAISIQATEQIFKTPRKHGWVETSFRDRAVTLTFAVKQRNLQHLRNQFEAISNPTSSQYRKFQSFDEQIKLYAPTDNTINLIKDWLISNRVPETKIILNPSKDFLIVENLSSNVASDLLNCKFRTYRNYITNEITQACVDELHLPSSIAEYIDFVGGVSHFPKPTDKVKQLKKVSLAASNSPIIVNVAPGDENFALFFIPFCPNGESPVQSQNLTCPSDGNQISSFQISATQFYNTQSQTVPVSDLVCGNCSFFPSALQSKCRSSNNQYSLPSDTLYCQTRPLTQFNLRNYYPINVTLTSNYNNFVSAPYKYPAPVYLGEFVSPQVLKDFYSISDALSICNRTDNTQSVAEFLGQYYSPYDLVSFFEWTNTLYPGKVELVGPNNITDPGTEASLDIQYLMGIAQNVTTYFWSLGNLHQGQEPFLEWIVQVLNDPHAPLVHSISYGDDENSLSSDYMNRVNNEFMKAGNVGVTLLFSSGDTGVNAGDPSAPFCTVNQKFVPAFPASSPYVTTVGGTQFSTNNSPMCSKFTQYGNPIVCNKKTEIAASIKTGARITSGGGFSNVFSMPYYQFNAVGGYLSKIQDSVPFQYFNQSGRAYPDISACARNFLVIVADSIHPTDGTSAAAPTAAAMMTLINNKLLTASNGLTKLGFINPTLYSFPSQAFLDIVSGENNCGEDLDSCCPYGFPTAAGWDAVTGFGSPYFPEFYNLF